MQVVTVLSEHVAHCQGMGQQKNIDMNLVGQQPVGTWVITFLDAAREVIDEDKALQVTNALEAVNLAMGPDASGIDDLFADIIERGPQLPPHLQAEIEKAKQAEKE